MIPIYKPYLNDVTKDLVRYALDSGWVSSQGQYIDMAKQLLKERLGVKHVILTCNGTAATYCLAKAVQYVKPKAEEVITSNNSYVASVNSFLHDDKYDILALDADKNTWNMDLSADWLEREGMLASGVIFVVHNMGNPVNVPALQRKFPNALIVEDACEALFGEYDGKPVGSAGLCASFSFFANKTITSGEGDAFVTNDDTIAKYIASYVNQGNTSTRFVHDTLAHNFRMTNLQAAMLCGQLLSVDEILTSKHAVFEAYRAKLSSSTKLSYQQNAENTKAAEWMFAVKLENSGTYLQAESFFSERNIDIRPMFYPYTRHEHLRLNSRVFCQKDDVAKELSEKVIVLPSYPTLTLNEIEHICDTLLEFVEKS